MRIMALRKVVHLNHLNPPIMRNLPALSLALLSAVALSACDSAAGFFGGSVLTLGIVGVLALILIIYAIMELLKSNLSTTEKIIWGIVIWVIPFIGAILFLVIGKK